LLIVAWPKPIPSGPATAPASEPSDPAAVDPAVDWPLPEGWWGSTEFGVRLLAPAGWQVSHRQGRDYLDRVPGSPREGNLCVVSIPNMRRLSFDQIVEENRRVFDDAPGLETIEMEPGALDGHQVLWTEFLATELATGARYHCRGIVFVRGNDQVVLTLTVDADRWDDLSDTATAVFDSLELRP